MTIPRWTHVASSGENGSKLNLAATRALWVDFDGDPGELSTKLETFPLPPSLLVNSGGGVHAYWILAEPFALDTEEARSQFENVLKGLTAVLGGDRAATDASRILRVAGTINLPDRRKRDKGRSAALCRIAAEGDETYGIDDFDDFEA